MMLAVGAYSGPRAACGAVAQPAKNAKHVTAAIRRMDTIVSSGFISVGDVRREGIREVCGRTLFAIRPYGNVSISRNSLHAVRNHRISLLNKVKPAERSGPSYKVARSSLPWPRASAQFLRRV